MLSAILSLLNVPIRHWPALILGGKRFDDLIENMRRNTRELKQKDLLK